MTTPPRTSPSLVKRTLTVVVPNGHHRARLDTPASISTTFIQCPRCDPRTTSPQGVCESAKYCAGRLGIAAHSWARWWTSKSVNRSVSRSIGQSEDCRRRHRRSWHRPRTTPRWAQAAGRPITQLSRGGEPKSYKCRKGPVHNREKSKTIALRRATRRMGSKQVVVFFDLRQLCRNRPAVEGQPSISLLMIQSGRTVQRPNNPTGFRMKCQHCTYI